MIHEQMSIENNVTLTVRDEAFNVIKTYHKRNRITNLALYGVAKLIFGNFVSLDEAKGYAPKYIAFGTGSTTPAPTDSGLENEITINNDEPVRVLITQRNIVNTNLANGVVKTVFRAYTSSSTFNGIALTEMGLFIEDSGNNLFARVGLGGEGEDPVIKTEKEVLDILWEVNVRSTTTGGVTNES